MAKILRRYRAILAIIFLVAIALRVGVPDVNRQIISGDETAYSYSALNMLRYHILTLDVTGQTYRGERPPTSSLNISLGYPIYIAAIYKIFGESPRNILISHVALSIFSFWLIYRLLIQLRVSRSATLCALTVAAVYPGFLYSVDRMLTEQLFIALFLSFICLFLAATDRGSRWILACAALVLSAATYVRPQALPFAFLGILYLMVYGADRRETIKQVAIFVGVIVGCFIPWWIRNYLLSHHFIPLTLAGEGPRVWGAVPWFLDMEDTAGKSLVQIAQENYNAAPAVYVHWKIFGYLNNMLADVWDENLSHPGRFLQTAAFVTQMLILVPVMAAMPWIVKRRVPAWTLIACIPLAVVALNAPFHGLPRYALPAVPFVILSLAVLLTKHPTVGGSSPSLSDRQSYTHRWGHTVFIWLSAIYSALVIYSIYVFPARIPAEMSSYRIGKYSHTTIDQVEATKPLSDELYTVPQMIVDNSIPLGSKRFQNVEGVPGIFKFTVGSSATTGNIVTKVTINIRGGAPYDYTVLYWTSSANPQMSESRVYRAPRFWFQHHRTFYIDGDASGFLMVPSALSGDRFTLNSVRVVKYRVPERN